MKKIMLVVALIAVSACTNRIGAERILEINGYTEIHITGHSFLGCSENDIYRTGFKAKSPSGQVVTGVVCDGLLKGATIRFF